MKTHIKSKILAKFMVEVWNLKDILKGQTVEELERELHEQVEKFVAAREELSPDMNTQRFAELIKQYEYINSTMSQIYAYFNKQYYANTTDQQAKAAMTKYEQMATEMGNKMIFFGLWFMHLKDKDANKFLEAEELKEYAYFLESIRRDKPFTKTEEIEQIMSLKSVTGRGAFFDIYQIMTSDFSFDIADKKGVTKDELISFVRGKDAALREEAYQKIFVPYKENRHSLTEIYKNIVLDWNNTGVKIRGHPTAISIRNWSNDIEDKATEALINVVRRNVNLFHEYFKIKHELNKQAGADYSFSRYHLYAPYQEAPETKYDYETSKEIVLHAYKEFDQRFYDAAKIIFDKHHVHSHPQKNKRGGAFCAWISKKVEPYILLNHDDTLNDVFTMMHEFGHGIHDIFTHDNVDLVAHPSLPMAETGSITGETILARKMLAETKDDKEKIAILVQKMNDYFATIIRQIYFVVFEQRAHELIQKGITVDELDAEYMNMLKEQFGEMDVPEEFAQEWHYIPHIHETPFYCYAYAWGNLLALALYKLVEEEGQTGKDKIHRILSIGGSMSAKDALAEIGIDPKDESFWQKGFDVIREDLENLKYLIR